MFLLIKIIEAIIADVIVDVKTATGANVMTTRSVTNNAKFGIAYEAVHKIEVSSESQIWTGEKVISENIKPHSA